MIFPRAWPYAWWCIKEYMRRGYAVLHQEDSWLIEDRYGQWWRLEDLL